MAWRMAGNYTASCSCNLICPCPVDGTPSDPQGKGECRGVAVFHIDQGNSDGVDLSGVSFALVNYFPANLTSGNWKIGVVIDESASNQQVDALGTILSGQAGGPFADFVPLIGENLGLQRAKVALSGTSGSIGGMSEFTFETLKGVDGSPTTVKNAMFGFAPEYTIGRTEGRSEVMGIDFDGNYGESARFEYSSESVDVHARA